MQGPLYLSLVPCALQLRYSFRSGETRSISSVDLYVLLSVLLKSIITTFALDIYEKDTSP